MIIHPAPPNSMEWLQARAGVVTASEFDQFLTTSFELRTGEMPRSYIARKVAERWIGGSLPGFQSIDMDIGQILEEEAIPFYEATTGEEITRVGLITTDDGKAGCSPDGLIGGDSGIEIKAPRVETHVKYLLNGKVPNDYLAQVHGALYITGRPRWIFMSYCRRLPPLIIQVNRNEKIITAIDDAIGEIVGGIDFAMNALEALNGGPPKRFQAREKKETQFVSTMPT